MSRGVVFLSADPGLTAAGGRAQLRIGPWTHGSPGLFRAAVADGVAWFRQHTASADIPAPSPVRIHVGGADEWRDLAQWPPPVRTGDWLLEPGGGLRPAASSTDAAAPDATAPAATARATDSVDAFVYDPADPTPAVGGPRLVARLAGRRDNRALEARPDVLVYTSVPLVRTVEIVGPVSATVHVAADGEHFDVFTRLCDVDRVGGSWNVCDGLVRVRPGRFPADARGVRRVEVEMWPTAYRFPVGHRLRLQVSGGAHPRFARNPGTGEPLASATGLRAVEVTMRADPEYPSAIHLPVVG